MNKSCRMCGAKFDFADEIDRCPDCLVNCIECGETPATRCITKTLARDGKPIAEITARICDTCDEEKALWTAAIVFGMSDKRITHDQSS